MRACRLGSQVECNERHRRQPPEGGQMTTYVLYGSCLCGAVRFEVRKPYLRFAHCYCQRCRKATGSSHATNLYVAPPQFSWVGGEGAAKRFDLPSAASF